MQVAATLKGTVLFANNKMEEICKNELATLQSRAQSRGEGAETASEDGEEPTDGQEKEKEPIDGQKKEEPTDGQKKKKEEPTDGQEKEEPTDGQEEKESIDGAEPTDGQEQKEPTDGAEPTDGQEKKELDLSKALSEVLPDCVGSEGDGAKDNGGDDLADEEDGAATGTESDAGEEAQIDEGTQGAPKHKRRRKCKAPE